MAMVLWFKARGKIVLGIMLAAFVPALAAFMPDEWYAKMGTIKTYEEDTSAMSRIHTWQFVTNLAKDRPIGGGGFQTFQPEAYARWAPEARSFDPHSIWFQMLGEHGFIGLGLFILFWILTWRTGAQVISMCRDRADLQWASDLAAMVQVSLIGFWVGGSFLGLAYWDYPYILMAVVVLTHMVVSKRIAEEGADAKVVGVGQPALRVEGR